VLVGHGEDERSIDYSSSLEGKVIIDVATGWLRDVARVPSPNTDERPADAEPALIVVHGISLPPGEFGGPWIDKLFTNELPADAHEYFAGIAGLRVSAHALIRRDGELRQYVPFLARAWHAGESSWCGRAACNDYSIGIELEGTDELAYTDVQYERLVALVLALKRTYASLRDADVVGHEHIAPGRKTDPGPAFDWNHFYAALDAREDA
jgi:AmpD protein